MHNMYVNIFVKLVLENVLILKQNIVFVYFQQSTRLTRYNYFTFACNENNYSALRV